MTRRSGRKSKSESKAVEKPARKSRRGRKVSTSESEADEEANDSLETEAKEEVAVEVAKPETPASAPRRGRPPKKAPAPVVQPSPEPEPVQSQSAPVEPPANEETENKDEPMVWKIESSNGSSGEKIQKLKICRTRLPDAPDSSPSPTKEMYSPRRKRSSRSVQGSGGEESTSSNPPNEGTPTKELSAAEESVALVFEKEEAVEQKVPEPEITNIEPVQKVEEEVDQSAMEAASAVENLTREHPDLIHDMDTHRELLESEPSALPSEAAHELTSHEEESSEAIEMHVKEVIQEQEESKDNDSEDEQRHRSRRRESSDSESQDESSEVHVEGNVVDIILGAPPPPEEKEDNVKAEKMSQDESVTVTVKETPSIVSEDKVSDIKGNEEVLDTAVKEEALDTSIKEEALDTSIKEDTLTPTTKEPPGEQPKAEDDLPKPIKAELEPPSMDSPAHTSDNEKEQEETVELTTDTKLPGEKAEEEKDEPEEKKKKIEEPPRRLRLTESKSTDSRPPRRLLGSPKEEGELPATDAKPPVPGRISYKRPSGTTVIINKVRMDPRSPLQLIRNMLTDSAAQAGKEQRERKRRVVVAKENEVKPAAPEVTEVDLSKEEDDTVEEVPVDDNINLNKIEDIQIKVTDDVREVKPRDTIAREVHEEKPEENHKIVRKISILNDEEKSKAPVRVLRSPSPSEKRATPVLYITNLVRPFTAPQLRELLARTGSIAPNGFFIDKIKSKCYVKYTDVEMAVETRHAIHGVRWPINNPKTLKVEFASLDDFTNIQRMAELDNKKPDPNGISWLNERSAFRPSTKIVLKRSIEEIDITKEDVTEDGRHTSDDDVVEVPIITKSKPLTQVQKTPFGPKVRQAKSPTPPKPKRVRAPDRSHHAKTEKVREWDVGKVSGEADTTTGGDDWNERPTNQDKSRSPRRRGGSPVPDQPVHKKRKDTEGPAKLLDDLFRKTKGSPCIYWLPLTAAQIAVKEEQRRKHMAEHARRIAELKKSELSRRDKDKERDRRRK